MTVIECISPSGLSVPPSFVLLSGPTPSFPDLSSKIGAIVTSPNGWTNNEIGTTWFIETFILFANNHKVTDAPILLLLDGHNSHESDAFRKAAFEHNIIVVAFPSSVPTSSSHSTLLYSLKLSATSQITVTTALSTMSRWIVTTLFRSTWRYACSQ